MSKKFQWGQTSIRRMDGVDPRIIRVLFRAIRIMSRKKDGIDMTIPYMGGIRTADEQNKLFLDGVSKCDGFEKKSHHQSGLAIVELLKEGEASVTLKSTLLGYCCLPNMSKHSVQTFPSLHRAAVRYVPAQLMLRGRPHSSLSTIMRGPRRTPTRISWCIYRRRGLLRPRHILARVQSLFPQYRHLWKSPSLNTTPSRPLTTSCPNDFVAHTST